MKNDVKFEDNQLVYPCNWIYKVIGEDAEGLEKDIKSLFCDKEFLLRESNKKGKYTSFSLTVKVSSELERDAIHMILKDNPFVKMLL